VTEPAPEEPLSGPAYLRLILLGAAIGIPAALVGAVFLAAVHTIEDWLWEDLPDLLGASAPPWYLVIGLPVVGAAIVLAARTLLPGDGGHSPIGGLSVEPTPLAHAPGVALAAIGTLAFGAILGPEAPLIALGSAVGAAFIPLARTGPQGNAVLATAGSFSAISALFGGPLVAGMLMVEAGAARLGAALIPALLPGLVAAAIGYVLFVGLGSWGGLNATPLAVPGLPEYEGTALVDLTVGLAVGVIAAALLVLVRRIAIGVDGLRERTLPMPVLLLMGGLAVGVLAQLTAVLGDDPNDVLFSGQAAIPTLVGETSASVVLVLLTAKALGYAICLGCGFRGGPVFPAIFLGIGLATLAVVAFDVSPTLAVAVGTAAGMTAMTRLVFASLLFAALLVGTQGVDTIPAAVLAASAAWVTSAALDRRATARSPSPSLEPD
jgi:H+/Cl- antiporter ClcA